MLVSRLRPILQRIVGPFQNSFLAGRGTSDNILITQEVVHSLVNLKGQRGGMILKLDIHKAYDTVSFQFLHETLLLLDLPNVLIELVMFSIKHMTTSNTTASRTFLPLSIKLLYLALPSCLL